MGDAEAFVKVAGAFVGVVALVVVFAILGAYPLKWCWNYAMPHISNGVLPEIGFWHAFCLHWVCHSLIRANATANTKK